MLTAAALLGASSSTWALGLGNIELDSALNEKLSAEIELLDADDLQPTEIIVTLASADDFERVGVERFFFLTDLRFEVAYGDEGVRNIQVTSTQPVTEPYLNFLVEVLWPSGRMLKEYTLLLDPPTFSPAPAPGVAAPTQSRQQDTGAGRVERRTETAGRGTQVQMAPSRQREPSPLDDGVVDGEYRMTDRSDTLWSIASRTRPSDAVSVQQNMLAIQRLNPDAFLNDNINLLKAGYSLRLPSEREALSLSDQEAGRMVAMQNEDWRALRRGETPPARGESGAEQRVAAAQDDGGADLRAPVDATPTSSATRESSGADGELRIVAGAGDAASGGVAIADADLDAALEEQDRLGREVEELSAELERERELASSQIAVKDRQLEVKDQQIAEMQAEMERMRAELERAQQQTAQSQNQSASGAWWQSPYVLGGGVGVVVLLLVYGLVAARRRRAAEDGFYPEVAETGAFEPVPAGAAASASASATAGAATAEAVTEPATEPDSSVLDLEDLEEPEEQARAEAGEGGSETSDVIGEADIYIAYGRYPQAIGLLLGVLEEDPNRNDVRLKLLELYAETRDREAFDAHMAELVERCDDDDALLTARELAQQFDGDERGDGAAEPGDGELVADLEEDEAVSLDELEPTAGTATASDELDLVSDDTTAPQGAEDFELELDDVSEQDVPAVRSAEAGESLGGDLGMDFDPERDRQAEEPADFDAEALSSADDLDLELDDTETLGDDAFDFEDEGDTASTKLDLARAYIDMGDQDGARDILNEVVVEGNAEQQQRAQAMLEEL